MAGDCALDVCRAQPRGEDEYWLAGFVGGVGGYLDEVEEFRGRGAYVEVAA